MECDLQRRPCSWAHRRNVDGLLHFVASASVRVLQDALWRKQSHRTLPALMGATDMLVCGEDLGMIPACVHPVMAELGLIGEQRG